MLTGLLELDNSCVVRAFLDKANTLAREEQRAAMQQLYQCALSLKKQSKLPRMAEQQIANHWHERAGDMPWLSEAERAMRHADSTNGIPERNSYWAPIIRVGHGGRSIPQS